MLLEWSGYSSEQPRQQTIFYDSHRRATFPRSSLYRVVLFLEAASILRLEHVLSKFVALQHRCSTITLERWLPGIKYIYNNICSNCSLCKTKILICHQSAKFFLSSIYHIHLQQDLPHVKGSSIWHILLQQYLPHCFAAVFTTFFGSSIYHIIWQQHLPHSSTAVFSAFSGSSIFYHILRQQYLPHSLAAVYTTFTGRIIYHILLQQYLPHYSAAVFTTLFGKSIYHILRQQYLIRTSAGSERIFFVTNITCVMNIIIKIL